VKINSYRNYCKGKVSKYLNLKNRLQSLRKLNFKYSHSPVNNNQDSKHKKLEN
jgi:hypothetical protein